MIKRPVALLFALVPAHALSQDEPSPPTEPTCLGSSSNTAEILGCDSHTLLAGMQGDPTPADRASLEACVEAAPEDLSDPATRSDVLTANLLALQLDLEDAGVTGECALCLRNTGPLQQPCFELPACSGLPTHYTLYCHDVPTRDAEPAAGGSPSPAPVVFQEDYEHNAPWAWRLRQEWCDSGRGLARAYADLPIIVVPQASEGGQFLLDGTVPLTTGSNPVGRLGCHDVQEVHPTLGVVRQARLYLSPETGPLDAFPVVPDEQPPEPSPVPAVPVPQRHRTRGAGAALLAAGVAGVAAGTAWHGACFKSWLPDEGCGRTRLTGSLTTVSVASGAVVLGGGLLVVDSARSRGRR